MKAAAIPVAAAILVAADADPVVRVVLCAASKSMKIDDETRDAAATLCLLAADYWIRRGVGGDRSLQRDRGDRGPYPDISDIGASLGASLLAHHLRNRARWAVLASLGWWADERPDVLNLEAAGLLLDGWCPGDPVERRAP